jgi:predicted NBD/HSP70 family sugar kinase
MKNKAGDQSLVRKANQGSIVEYLRKNGPTSKAKLSRVLKISKPTVAKNIEELLKEKILYEYGEGESSGGRKPLLIAFNPNYKFVLSLEINVNYPMIALYDLHGKILTKIKLSMSSKIKEAAFLNRIYTAVEKMMSDEAIKDDRIGVITVSTPGIINEETGDIYANPQFKDWEKVNLVKELKNRFNKKVIVKNDISMAALGEKHYGIGKNYKNLIYISSTLGIGAGLILNGKLYEGLNKAAGEIGYFVTKDQINSNQNLENEFAVPMILEKISGSLQENQDSLLYELTAGDPNQLTLAQVVECINLADPYVLSIIDEAAVAYGIAVNNISILLDLECVIIGGALAELGVYFIERMKDIVKKNNPLSVEVMSCGLKENASLYGNYIVGNEYITKNLIK